MVFDDYDVEQAVNYAAFGAFIGAGQTCVCASRHIVQRGIYDEFVERLQPKRKAIRIGDPRDPNTQLGPVISERQLDRVLSFVQARSATRMRGWSPAASGVSFRGTRTASSSSRPCSPT